jgi:ATP-binding cassette subfamily B protein/subfamily B ATP-binding cassette protein MsbA
MASDTHVSSFLPYVLRQWRWIVAISIFTTLASAAASLQPWPVKILVDHGLGDAAMPNGLASVLERLGLPRSTTALILVAAASSLGLFVLTSALTVALSVSWSMAGQRMVYDVAGDVFARLQRLSLLFHSRRSVGDSMSRLMEDTWCIYTLADGFLIAPVQHVLSLAMMIWIGFLLDPLLAMLALAVAPLLAVSSWYFGPPLKQRSHALRDARARLMSFVHQTLGALPVVQAFNTAGRNSTQFRVLAANTVKFEQRANFLGSAYGLINGLVTTVGLALVLYVGGVRVLSGAISIGTLLVFIAYVRQMQGATGGLIQIFTKLKTAQASIERLLEVLNAQETIQQAPNARLLKISHGQSSRIEFENVTFGYDPGKIILEDISLAAEPGEMIALVGPTGAGKSTLISLIPRFFDPWRGRVLIDGADVRELELASLRDAISIVLQEPFLLPLTIAGNIAYGRPDASRDEIIAAAVAARADDFISRLPDGYDTPVGEGGATLSVGEQQRISIARALLKDAPILILDEPTSALDVCTESLLLEAVERLTKGRTTFTIAHRMSTIRRASRVAVVEHGRIAACGTHDELLGAGGLYEKFVRQQTTGTPAKVVA